MKKVKQSNSQGPTLDSFCQDSSSIRTKIALSTFYKVRYPDWVEKFIVIVEYLQLMSQAILSASFSYRDSPHNLFIFQSVIYALKLANPSYLLSYDADGDSTISTVLIIVLSCVLVKILLFVSIVYDSLKDKKTNSWLLYMWRWVFKFQTRVFYYLFTSFWVRAMIEARDGNFSAFRMKKSHIWCVGSVVLAVELVFSLILETQSCYSLPTKNFLSSKNHRLQMMTLMQKFILQVFTLLFKSDSEALAWIIPIVGFIIDGQRFDEFGRKFPLYHTRALMLQGSLMSMVISVNFVNFVNIALQSNNCTEASLQFVIITWILLALLTIKITRELLKVQILSLLTTNKHNTPEILLHKVTLTKELQHNEKIPTLETSNCSFNYLVLKDQLINIENVFGLPPQEDLSDETMIKKTHLLYCQELAKRYPKNSLVKLFTAYRAFKNSASFPQVIKMINEVQGSKWSQNHLSSSLLLHEVEKSIRNNQQQRENELQNLDFSTYIQRKMQVNSVKKIMLE